MDAGKTVSAQKIVDDLLNHSLTLAQPLLKLNYFAKLIKNESLITYSHNELNGYKNPKAIIPDYRKTHATITAIIQDDWRGDRRPMEILPAFLEEPFRHQFQTFTVTDSIQVLEKTVHEKTEENGDSIIKPFPLEFLPHLQPGMKLYKSNFPMSIVSAYSSANANFLIEVISNVRTKLLDFVIQLSESFGDNIEINDFNQKQSENNNTVIQYFMSTVVNNSGDGALINTGKNASIQATISFTKGDTNELMKELEKNGVTPEEAEELVEIVKAEEPNYETGTLGQKTYAWLNKITEKSLTPIGNGIVVQGLWWAIKAYFGIPI